MLALAHGDGVLREGESHGLAGADEAVQDKADVTPSLCMLCYSRYE